MPINLPTSTLQMLLAKLNQGAPLPDPAKPLPVPLAPVPNLGPLSTETTAAYGALNPEPVPPRIVQPAPVDTNFVNQYSGSAPTPPAPATRLQRIAAALQGFGAGVSGEGAQFLYQLREPERRYQAQQEQYQDRRARALELAERRAEREAELANRANELAYERDFKTWLQKNNTRDDESKERMRQAFELEKEARRARLETDRELARERRQREVDARQIEERYFTATKNRALSRELGRHWAGLSTGPLSPAAARLDQQVQGIGEVRMRRSAGIGGGGGTGVSNAAMKALANFNGALEEVRGAVQRQDVRGERLARRKMDVMHGRLSQFPRDIEAGIGTGGWPYAKLRNAPAPTAAPGLQPQGQPSQQRAQAKAKLLAAGFGDQEADAELNRLGIQ